MLRLRERRDMTDERFRRALRALGFRERAGGLACAVTELVVHPNRPGEEEAMLLNGESRREAVERLRQWAWGKDK